MSDRYDTRLTPEQEALFEQWRAMLPAQLRGDADYDLRGAFLDQAQPSADAHLTDRFKKPNHRTFSDESMYAPLAPHMAGGWRAGDEYVPSVVRSLADLMARGPQR